MEQKYCEIIDVENYLLKDIESGFETQVEDWIRGVSRMMDQMANRTLVAPVIGSGEDFEIRNYDGNGKMSMRIDDAQEITKISIGDMYGLNPTTLSVSDYLFSPKQPPYRTIYLKNDIFYSGIQNVEIEGRFGYFNEVPADLKLACSIIVAGIVNAQIKGNLEKKSESIGNYSVSYGDAKGLADYNNAIGIINSYKKYDF